MATSPFPDLKKAVSRLVKAEVAFESIQQVSQQMEHLAIHQELDNARANYKYRLEKLRMALYTKEVV